MPNEIEAAIEAPEPFSAELLAKCDELWGKKFVRIDPATKKPHEQNKQFFWQIVGQYPATRAGENMNAPVMHFEIQRYWRDKTYKAPAGPNDTHEVTKHVPWTGQNWDGELIPGSMQISYPDFIKQFVAE